MWRFDYTSPVTKKRNTMSIGAYPQISLAKACEYRDQYQALIAAGKAHHFLILSFLPLFKIY